MLPPFQAEHAMNHLVVAFWTMADTPSPLSLRSHALGFFVRRCRDTGPGAARGIGAALQMGLREGSQRGHGDQTE